MAKTKILRKKVYVKCLKISVKTSCLPASPYYIKSRFCTSFQIVSTMAPNSRPPTHPKPFIIS